MAERSSGRVGPPRAWAQIYLLARLSWKEGVRRRLLVLGFALTAAFVVLYGLGAYYSLRHVDFRFVPGNLSRNFYRDLAAFQMLSLGMFTASFLGAMLVCFSAAGMVTGDAEAGLLQPLLTRPVSRVQLVLGRYLGYASIYLAYLVILTAALILLTSVFGHYTPPSPVAAVALLAVQGLVLLALVALFSVRFPPLTTGIAAFMLFGFSFVGGFVREVARLVQSGTAERLGTAVYGLIPTDPFFRMSLSRLSPKGGGPTEALVRMGPFSGEGLPLLWLIYGLAYLGMVLFLALLLFRRKDL